MLLGYDLFTAEPACEPRKAPLPRSLKQLVPRLEQDLKGQISENEKQTTQVTNLAKRARRLQDQDQPMSIQAKEYIKQLIVDMELEQIAESIVRVQKRI